MMNYTEATAMIRASKSFEGVDPMDIMNAIDDMLQNWTDADDDDLKMMVAAGYELGLRGMPRRSFMGLIR